MNEKTTIIAVVGFKGGVTKTTTTVHLAGHLAGRGEVIAVDGDDRVRSLTTYAIGGHLPFRVMSLVEAMRAQPRYMVIDVRGGLPDVELVDLAKACDAIVLPASPELMSLDGLRRTMDVIRDLGEKGQVRAKVLALLTMSKPGNKLVEARRVLGSLGIPVMESGVRFSEAFKDASSAQILVKDVKTNPLAASCWLDYGRVTDELLTVLGEVD